MQQAVRPSEHCGQGLYMRTNLTRRRFLKTALGASSAVVAPHIARSRSEQRAVIVMCDGLGIEYYDQSAMPRLKAWAAAGVHVHAQGVMPTVTNCNNASICCGAWPSEHGVIGNSYFDEATGSEEYMEDASLVVVPTIFQRARAHGIRSALLSAKKKTISLLNRGTDILLTAEAPEGS
jgi:phosphonoacetate hydrolase